MLECAFEVEEGFLYVIIPLALVLGFFLAVAVYHYICLDVVNLGISDFLSIDPDKWFPPS